MKLPKQSQPVMRLPLYFLWVIENDLNRLKPHTTVDTKLDAIIEALQAVGTQIGVLEKQVIAIEKLINGEDLTDEEELDAEFEELLKGLTQESLVSLKEELVSLQGSLIYEESKLAELLRRLKFDLLHDANYNDPMRFLMPVDFCGCHIFSGQVRARCSATCGGF